jgi:hypothetical protein
VKGTLKLGRPSFGHLGKADICTDHVVPPKVSVNNGNFGALAKEVGAPSYFETRVRKVTTRIRLGEEHHISWWVGPRIKVAAFSERNFLEVAMTRIPLEAIIQCCRSLYHQFTGQAEIEKHLKSHEYTLSPEVRSELERRCEGQYGD